ncbi:MAG: cytochrome c3 family protein [Candidatus Margulisiibacteriota bacterium]
MTMADISKGKFCGVCHAEKGKAFPVAGNCGKCHVKPGA